MRFLLTLLRNSVSNRIPINYQYELSAWLYRIVEKSSPEFSHFLHEKGYTVGHKHFKLFTFSNLYIPTYQIDKEKSQLVIQSPTIQWQVSFCVDEAAEHFIQGLFLHQHLTLADKRTKVEFTITGVEVQPPPIFTEVMRFRTLSPLCVSIAEERNGKLMPQYLSPDDNRFADAFFANLVQKYIAAGMQMPQPVGEAADASEEVPMQLRLLSAPKSRLLTIKAGTREESRVRGFTFDFDLQAPASLLEFGYQAGFGEKNSLGFGCVEVIYKKGLV
jgi:CRISPR-associated endoribonuclease Cas6